HDLEDGLRRASRRGGRSDLSERQAEVTHCVARRCETEQVTGQVGGEFQRLANAYSFAVKERGDRIGEPEGLHVFLDKQPLFVRRLAAVFVRDGQLIPLARDQVRLAADWLMRDLWFLF